MRLISLVSLRDLIRNRRGRNVLNRGRNEARCYILVGLQTDKSVN